MSATPTSPPRAFPLWLKAACSACAVGHLLILALSALSAPSGPWPMPPPINESMGEPPQFAKIVTQQFSARYYLEPLHMTHNYHFASNRPSVFAVYFEVQVTDQAGATKTLKFPDDRANFWVRHRQALLAQYLVPDQRRERRPLGLLEEGAAVPTVEIWQLDGERTLRLTPVPENAKILQSPDIEEPTPRVNLLARSYTRFVAQEHEAASAQLIRHSRLTVMPSDLYVPRPADFYLELKSYFGEYRRE